MNFGGVFRGRKEMTRLGGLKDLLGLLRAPWVVEMDCPVTRRLTELHCAPGNEDVVIR
jgi:hypothetical protein